MKIRKYREEECLKLLKLFFDTVRNVNIKDYTQEQVAVWAPDNYIEEKYGCWSKTLKENFTVIAETDGKITGFADITPSGYLDRLFVHKDYQGTGIASALLEKILEYAYEQNVEKVITEASITARPFFEKHNFVVIQEQQVERSGVFLTNFLMEEQLFYK